MVERGSGLRKLLGRVNQVQPEKGGHSRTESQRSVVHMSTLECSLPATGYIEEVLERIKKKEAVAAAQFSTVHLFLLPRALFGLFRYLLVLIVYVTIDEDLEDYSAPKLASAAAPRPSYAANQPPVECFLSSST
jgi:hypothetical protein